MSLDSVRNHILSNSSEGRVEVNQRDLIYKILARYVVNYDVFIIVYQKIYIYNFFYSLDTLVNL